MLQCAGAGCKLYHSSCYWNTAFYRLLAWPFPYLERTASLSESHGPPSRTKPTKIARKKLPPERGKVPVGAARVASPPVIDIAENDDSSDSEDDSSLPPSTSSSGRFSQKRKLPGGPKKASSVWRHYTEDAVTGASTCKACKHGVKPAGKTGNAVSHLKNRHPDAFAKYEEKDLKKKK
ncbi:hypothetical protein RvY_01109 [Ramazzottius varieornatus]|uniref:BED-type domain-containing protein n=1 Tax=Ramazzottius varieornatus TaxID=947166 RepID=A0A1D1UG20_RAMVA|nr:hypothetical protein RvY_01109 [Ramazzottius varieornatus]